MYGILDALLAAPSAWRPCLQIACLAGPICMPVEESIPALSWAECRRSKVCFQSRTVRQGQQVQERAGGIFSSHLCGTDLFEV